MTVLSGQSIRRRGIFTPFSERTSHHGLTYGLGPSGYDVRIAEDIVLPPGGFTLASTMEHFDIPADLVGIVHDKSTWARRGITLQNTVAEPGWRGYLTLEITNHNPPRRWWQFWRRGAGTVVLRRGMPIAQIIFHALDEPAEKAYDGKYQDQKSGPQPALFR